MCSVESYGLVQKEAVARRYYFVQKALPLMRQRQNAQKSLWEASFPRDFLCMLFPLLCNVNLLNESIPCNFC